jgi:hypothetical protein
MQKMDSLTARVPAYRVEIFICGDEDKAFETCQRFCTDVGLCVTFDRTLFIFRGGNEYGMKIGLINYGRFPRGRNEIWDTAMELALLLKAELRQGSFTVQDDQTSHFYSTRVEDGCTPTEEEKPSPTIRPSGFNPNYL